MKYIKVIMDTNYAGTREEEYWSIPDYYNESEIIIFVSDLAANALSVYEYLALDDIYLEDFETENQYCEAVEAAIAQYWEDIYIEWEECSYTEWEENGGQEYCPYPC